MFAPICRFLPLAVAAATCLLILPLTVRSARAADDPPARQTFVTPFTPWRHQGGPLVTVWLNDKTPVRLLLDTGADECFLRESVARKMGLTIKDAAIHGEPISFGGTETSKFAVLDKVEIGSLRFNKVPFIVLHSLDNEMRHEDTIDGMIGLPVLSKFAMFLDYVHHTAAFIYPGKLSDAEIATLGFTADAGAGKAPLRKTTRQIAVPGNGVLIKDDLYSTHLTLHNGDKTAGGDIWVDTGAGTSNIDAKWAHRIGLVAEKTSSEWTHATGSELLNEAHVPKLEVGNFPVSSLKVAFAPEESSDFPPLLGADVLSFCNVLFDYPAETLYLRPVLAPLAPAPVFAAGSAPAPVDGVRLGTALATTTLGYGDDPRLDGTLYRTDDELAAATAAAEAAVASASAVDKPACLDTLAAAYLHQGANEKAADTFTAASAAWGAAAPNTPGAARALAKTPGHIGRAEDLARTLTERQPENPEAWAALGECLERRACFVVTGSPFSLWEQPVSIDHEMHKRVFAQRAAGAASSEDRLKDAAGMVEEADKCFDKAVQLAPNDAARYRERADFRIRAAIDVACPTRLLKGKSADIDGQTETYALREDIEKAADLLPNDVEAQAAAMTVEIFVTGAQNGNDIGHRDEPYWSLLPGRSRKAAQAYLDRIDALRQKPGDPVASARAAEMEGLLVSGWLEDDKRAEDLYKEALTKDPKGSGRALRFLADLMTTDQRYDDLLPILTAHAADQDVSYTHLLLARTLDADGKDSAALAEAEKAVAQRPDGSAPNLLLAVLLLRRASTGAATEADDVAQATACLDRADAARPALAGRNREQCDDAHAAAFALLGQPDKAEALALRTLDDDRADTDAREILDALLPLPPTAAPDVTATPAANKP